MRWILFYSRCRSLPLLVPPEVMSGCARLSSVDAPFAVMRPISVTACATDPLLPRLGQPSGASQIATRGGDNLVQPRQPVAASGLNALVRMAAGSDHNAADLEMCRGQGRGSGPHALFPQPRASAPVRCSIRGEASSARQCQNSFSMRSLVTGKYDSPNMNGCGASD